MEISVRSHLYISPKEDPPRSPKTSPFLLRNEDNLSREIAQSPWGTTPLTDLFANTRRKRESVFLEAKLILRGFPVHGVVKVHTRDVAVEVVPVAHESGHRQYQKCRGNPAYDYCSHQSLVGGGGRGSLANCIDAAHVKRVRRTCSRAQYPKINTRSITRQPSPFSVQKQKHFNFPFKDH